MARELSYLGRTGDLKLFDKKRISDIKHTFETADGAYIIVVSIKHLDDEPYIVANSSDGVIYDYNLDLLSFDDPDAVIRRTSSWRRYRHELTAQQVKKADVFFWRFWTLWTRSRPVRAELLRWAKSTRSRKKMEIEQEKLKVDQKIFWLTDQQKSSLQAGLKKVFEASGETFKFNIVMTAKKQFENFGVSFYYRSLSIVSLGTGYHLTVNSPRGIACIIDDDGRVRSRSSKIYRDKFIL